MTAIAASAPGRTHWSSNLLFMITAIGAEAGIANVWKFSYLAGANGGGLFVLLYFVALTVIAIPALMAEMLLGRHGGRSVVGTMRVLVERDGLSPGWKVFGALAITCTFIVMSYYQVICGWMLQYFVLGASGGFHRITSAGAAAAYAGMLANPWGMLGYSGLLALMTATVVGTGVNKGIERVSGVLTPLRFLILLGLLAYSVVFADFPAAARFLFTIDWSKLTPTVVVLAFGQAFFSLGVGGGVMMTMAAYMGPESSVPKSVFTVAFAQGFVALIAGLSIFPLVFGYHLQPTQGPGLVFVTLPVAFGQMPYGELFGSLLFLLLSFAALTATIVIQETIVAFLVEYVRAPRPVLAFATSFAIWSLGVVTVLSFNAWRDVHLLAGVGPFATKTPFELLDYLTSNIMMPLGGLMVALMAGWALPRAVARETLGLKDGPAFKVWRFAVRYVVPAVIVVVMVSIWRS